MAKKPKDKVSNTETTRVISFRIAADLHDLLEKQGADLRDETGLPLNASGVARRMVMKAIKETSKTAK